MAAQKLKRMPNAQIHGRFTQKMLNSPLKIEYEMFKTALWLYTGLDTGTS